MWRFLSNSRRTGLLSPDGRFQSCLGTPRELWGSYVSPLAIWTTRRPSGLVYHREGYSAHALALTGPVPFAIWSTCGQWVSFYEWKRQEAYQLALGGGWLSRLSKLLGGESGLFVDWQMQKRPQWGRLSSRFAGCHPAAAAGPNQSRRVPVVAFHKELSPVDKPAGWGKSRAASASARPAGCAKLPADAASATVRNS